MKGRRATLLAIVALATILIAFAGYGWNRSQRPVNPLEGVGIKLRMVGVRESVRLLREDSGDFVFLVDDGTGIRRVAPEAFAEFLYVGEVRRDWLSVIFNITSPIGRAWVALGLGGQLLFTGRMVVQ